MIAATLLGWVTFIYFAAFVFYLIRMIRENENWGKLAGITTFAGLAVQSIALVIRWKTSYDLGMGHVPLANFYESLVFFAWSIVLLYGLMEWRLKNRALGVFVLPVAFLLLAYASIAPGMNNHIEPLIPALQSNWLTSHVLTCFMGYAAFTVPAIKLPSLLWRHAVPTCRVCASCPPGEAIPRVSSRGGLVVAPPCRRTRGK